ncbi:MAG: ABC transporter permease [Lactobacillaceae bacterium]|jgi:spermidine/putrescine transport system permease protein|nr:ABC transporter permease [Lactobacillaceae bacterium]
MKKLAIGKIYLIFVFILLYLPIFYLIVYSFNSGQSMNGWAGFTFNHYHELFSDARMIEIVLNTLIVAVLSSLISTIIGTIGAYWIYQTKNKKIANRILSLNSVLLVSPDVIIGASFLILFTVVGMQLGFLSVLLSHVAFSIPIVVLMVLPKLKEMPKTIIEASDDLGATGYQTLSNIILPYIQPGILAGFFMALTYSLDDFAVTFFVTGNGFSTMAVEIYSRARRGTSLEINALSAIMFLVSLFLVLIYYFISNPKKGGKK